MRRSKQTIFILSPKDPNVTRKISRGNFAAEKLCFYVLWAREGEGLGLLHYMGYQRFGRPQRVWLLEGVNFIHIRLKYGVFFNLAWHWVFCLQP